MGILKHSDDSEVPTNYARGYCTECGFKFWSDYHRKVCSPESKMAEEPKSKTLLEVFDFYEEAISNIHTNNTVGEFTWRGLLHEFLREALAASGY